MRCDKFMCDIWLIYMWYIHVMWWIHVWHMTLSYVTYTCDVSNFCVTVSLSCVTYAIGDHYMRHVSFLCDIVMCDIYMWLIHVWHMTLSYVTYTCDVFNLCLTVSNSCVTYVIGDHYWSSHWFFKKITSSLSHVWHMSHSCVTYSCVQNQCDIWLIHVWHGHVWYTHMNNPCMPYDSFICDIYMHELRYDSFICDIYMWGDSFLYDMWVD